MNNLAAGPGHAPRPVSNAAPTWPDLSRVSRNVGRVPAAAAGHPRITPGEHLALLGGKGSGKSTLPRSVLGCHVLSPGRITVVVQGAANPDYWMPKGQATKRSPMLVTELQASSAWPQDAADVAIADDVKQSGPHGRTESRISGPRMTIDQPITGLDRLKEENL